MAREGRGSRHEPWDHDAASFTRTCSMADASNCCCQAMSGFS
jgi:hypothetical protein